MDHPTLLRRPDLDPIISQVEKLLPGMPADYIVWQVGKVWTVRHGFTGEVIYTGPGPVEVVRSPAPL